MLDTNVISEPSKPRPDEKVVAWLATTDEDRLHLSVGTLAELRFGLDRLPNAKRKRALAVWLANDLLARFERRILGVDIELGMIWGSVIARRERDGRPIEVIDALLAATAMQHRLTLVTRNTADFGKLPLTLLNPWDGSITTASAP